MGAMRAASRVAGFGVNGGFRGAASSLPLQQQQEQSTVSVSTQGRRVAPIACSNAPALISTTDKVVDDWEFIEEEEEEEHQHPLPSLVFSAGVPSLQEAKEATSDLKHAFEREYFSNSISFKTSSTTHESTLLSSGYLETKACITSGSALVHSVSKPIFRAFSMLTECPQAQGVVASLASDKNVWDAVMQNEKVMKFIKKQQNGSASEVDDTNIRESEEDLKSSSPQVKSAEAGNNNELMEFIWLTVTYMVNSLSGFFQNMFGSPTEEKMRIDIDSNGNATVTTAGLGASFMALAVLAIMVAVLKRGG